MAEYIAREAALSFPLANGKYDKENANEHFIYGCETYKEWIENLPAADVRPVVHGKWIHKDGSEEAANCSVCGGSCWYYDYAGDVWDSKYCPNCGAEMEAET